MSVAERAKESRAPFHAAYKILMERAVTLKNNEAAVLDAIRAFYFIFDGQEHLKPELENGIVALDTNKRWDLLCQLVREAVNRDLCAYVSTGTNPKGVNAYNTHMKKIMIDTGISN